MAKIVRTEERDGHLINVYESGAEYDTTDKKLIRPPASSLITAENVTVFNRRRKEKAAAALRARIVEAHNKKMDVVKSSAAAFADSGALLYEEIVLNDNAYPRDRMDTWEKLGKYADVLPADIRQVQPEQPATGAVAGVAVEMAAAFARVIADIVQAQTIQPVQVIDMRSDNVVDSE